MIDINTKKIEITFQGNESFSDDSTCCEPTYIKLVAKDGHEFIVCQEIALKSRTIKGMLKLQLNESHKSHMKEVWLDIESHILQKICLYLTIKGNSEDYQDIMKCNEHAPPEEAIDVLMAAYFLEI